MAIATDELVRLSSYVLFVDYGTEVEVQHTVRGSTVRINRETYEDLLHFRGFSSHVERHARWIEEGILVPPFHDRAEYHGGFRQGTEAKLGRDYQDWYWTREVEAEREYRWLGRSIVKMPSDLFFYQELMATNHINSVLEIGYGDGGGLWFFASVLELLDGGHVVGVDWDLCDDPPQFERFARTRVLMVPGDAHNVATVEAVRALQPDRFGLVVLDADPSPAGKVALLRRWSALVAPGGFLVVEDVESPACVDAGGLIVEGLDRFLLEEPNFGVAIEAARCPLLKARGAVLRRLNE